MVTGSSQRICLAKHAVALEVCAKVRLHWKDRFGCCALRKPVTNGCCQWRFACFSGLDSSE
ncbi:hypothetical protein BL143_00004690, partial [Klebsiella pneumoniae]